MIKHIAMFKFKTFKSVEEKEMYYERLREVFNGLDDRVPAIKSLQIGFDELGSEASFDFAVNVDIEKIDDLPAYANHPEHLKAVDIIKEMVAERKVIDYSF